VSFSGPPYTLRVLASTELASMTPVLREAAAMTGVSVKFTHIGSIAGVREVIDGTAGRDKFDAVWFDSDYYLNLYPDGFAKLNGTTQIAATPVILAVRTSAARRLGWDHASVTWADIAKAAAAGEFTFGMADPGTSSSGLSALVSVATALAGKDAALQAPDVAHVLPELTSLFHAQRLTAPTSGELTQAFLRDLKQPSRAPDGIIDYESQLLALQAQAPRDDQITLVYPAGGTLEATYPLSILSSASPAAKDAYQRLAAYLTSPQAQQEITRTAFLRPIAGSVPLPSVFAHHRAFALPFPRQPSTVTDLIDAYFGRLRVPGRSIYVLDTSASMQGTRLSYLEQALLALTGASSSLAGESSMFRDGEQVIFLPFNYGPQAATIFMIPAHNPAAVLSQIRGYITGLRAHGRTAIFDALIAAYKIMAAQDRTIPGRIGSIVLMTDGENDWGQSLGAFLAYYRSLPPGSPAPPVYVIAFGQADLPELHQVAIATGGTLFDVVHEPLNDLTAIVADVRGYQ
jgi:Ca-activated chloride channel family protein